MPGHRFQRRQGPAPQGQGLPAGAARGELGPASARSPARRARPAAPQAGQGAAEAVCGRGGLQPLDGRLPRHVPARAPRLYRVHEELLDRGDGTAWSSRLPIPETCGHHVGPPTTTPLLSMQAPLSPSFSDPRGDLTWLGGGSLGHQGDNYSKHGGGAGAGCPLWPPASVESSVSLCLLVPQSCP